MLETLPRKIGKVERIFIHLEHNTPPEKFDELARWSPRPRRRTARLALYEMDSSTPNQSST